MKKRFILILLAVFAFCFTACKMTAENNSNTGTEKTDGTDTENSGSSEESSSVICPSYFWGKWTRMDNGTEYEIGESEVKVVSTGSTTTAESYAISSVVSTGSTTAFTCSLGTFTKDTDNVFKIGSIPVFRNGGSNIEYTVTFVGFSDSARAATAGSTAGNLGSGYTATAADICTRATRMK